MKKLNLLVSLILLTLSSTLSYAQAPSSFNYQAVLRDAGGSIIANQTVAMRFSVRTGSANGLTEYREEQELTTNEFGLVDHAIGTGMTIFGDFEDITWGNESKFLRVELDNGDGYVNLGTQQLLSVPYALHAKTAEAVTGGTNWSAAGNDVYSNNTGNVGIGTTSPENKLTILASNATVELRDLEEATRLVMLPPSTEATGGVGTSGGDLQLFTEAGDRLTISNTTGNVGIGTLIPSFGLDVRGADTVDGAIISVGNSDLSRSLSFFGGQDNDPNPLIRWKDNTHLRFAQETEDGTNFFELMRILDNGNVGIGTADPIQKLDVNGRINVTNGVIQRGGSPVTSTNDLGLYSRVPGNIMRFSTNDAPIRFYTDEDSGLDLGGNITRMSIEPSGNIGIGTTTPEALLDIAGNLTVGSVTGTVGRNFINQRINGVTDYSVLRRVDPNYAIWAYDLSETDPTPEDDLINIGIWISRIGNAIEPYADGLTDLGFSAFRWKDIYAINSTIQTSDKRMKKDITPLSLGLNEIMQLEPVTYNWKDSRQGGHNSIGFIAQDVESIIPQAVVHNKLSAVQLEQIREAGKPVPEIEDPYGMKYVELIPVLVKSIQEQQMLIENQQGEINAMKAEIEALKNK